MSFILHSPWYNCPAESKPFLIASKARQSLLSRVRERGLWIKLIAIAESVCTSQRPSLGIEVFFLTYRRCSKIYIIIPVMFSLAFLTAILMDSDVCRLGLAAAGSVCSSAKWTFFSFLLMLQQKATARRTSLCQVLGRLWRRRLTQRRRTTPALLS